MANEAAPVPAKRGVSQAAGLSQPLSFIVAFFCRRARHFVRQMHFIAAEG